MNRNRIRRDIFQRCLLTEVAPFETPLIWSNWGSYNYFRSLCNRNPPKYIKTIFEDYKSATIPYNYVYNKNIAKIRTLSIMHPNASLGITEIYKNFSLMIIRLCQKSSFSLRRPHSIAKYFLIRKGNDSSKKKDPASKYVELLDENKVYVSSYFVYLHFSHLHKFFESPGYTAIEKIFQYRSHFDITKCFPSIYTHSIDWAIRGKEAAKERVSDIRRDTSFGGSFDKFMQRINHNETNGILIGPEFSRIFAEIILQDVDEKIESAMKMDDLTNGNDYCCVRYIDDYYLFYNRQEVFNKFCSVIADELEKYKLYLGSDKQETISRPFISSISIKKIHVSNYIQKIVEELQNPNLNTISSEKEINKIRSIMKENSEENIAITNFFISALSNKMWVLNKLRDMQKYIAIRLFVDIAFYLLRIDTRVSSIYRITKFIIDINKEINSIQLNEKTKILDKIYLQLYEALSAAEGSKMMIETMNLLIAATEFKSLYPLELEKMQKIFDFCKSGYYDDKINSKRMTYFEIIAILYYIQDDQVYETVRSSVLKEVENIFKYYSPKRYSESAHLLMDVVSCPFLEIGIKRKLVKLALNHLDASIQDNEINHFIKFVGASSWYTNWNSIGNLDTLLKKKEFLSPY